MKHFNSTMKAFCVSLLTVLWGLPAFAGNYPTVKELIGRYTFNGECVLDNDVTVPKTTGYEMAVLPGAGADEICIYGFLGYGGGITATYNQENGTLACTQVEAAICMQNTLMVALDGKGVSLNLNYQVELKNGVPVITALSDLTAKVIDMSAGVWGNAVCKAGYTLTKSTQTWLLADVTGDYDITTPRVELTTVMEATEDFTLTIQAKDNNKVELSGWFGLDEKLEGTYMESGIILLPHDALFANGMYFGNGPDGYNPDVAPYFFVGQNKVTSPCSFVLDNGADMTNPDEPMPLQFSFIGAEGIRKGSAVSTLSNDILKVYGSEAAIVVENANVEQIALYDVQGMRLATSVSASARFDGLARGIYIVKVGRQVRKVKL